MKSKATPWTHTGVTAQEITTKFGPSGSVVLRPVTVPKGTLCVKLEGGSPTWVVQDLSFIADKNSILYHDADHYGIRIPEEQISHMLPAGTPRPVSASRTDVVYYGTVNAPAGAELKLRRAGAEVSDHDNKGHCFYVRVTPESSEVLLSDLEQDGFAIDLHARKESDKNDWLRDIKTMPVQELAAERAYHQFWVHSDENDGRLTSDSSAELDIRFDQLEAIDKRLKELAPPANDGNGTKTSTQSASPPIDDSPSM